MRAQTTIPQRHNHHIQKVACKSTTLPGPLPLQSKQRKELDKARKALQESNLALDRRLPFLTRVPVNSLNTLLLKSQAEV